MFDTSRVEVLAKENGLSNSFLAKKLGRTSASLFVDWRKGKSKPSENDMERLADILHTSADYLLGKTDIKEKPTTMSELSEDDKVFLKAFRAASPEKQAAILALIKDAK